MPVGRELRHDTASGWVGALTRAGRVAAAVFGVTLAAYVLYGLSTLMPIAPVVAGLMGAYLGLRDWRWTSLVVAVGQTLGFWGAKAAFAVGRVSVARAQGPAYINEGVHSTVYRDLLGSIAGSNSTDSVVTVMIWLIGLGLAVVVAVLLERSGILDGDTILPRAVFFGGLLLVGVAFIVTLYGATGVARKQISTEPRGGEYAVDFAIYEKVLWLMDREVPYYQALPDAAGGDARLIEEGSVQDGRFVAWATSPSMVRQPWTFRFLHALSPGGPGGAFHVSAVCALLVLLGFAAALSLRSRAAGLSAGLALYPFMIMGAGWQNIMMPDWWATLAVMGSAAALLSRKPALRYLAIALAIAAALFRETAAPWLVLMLGTLAWDWWQKGRGRQQLAALLAGLLGVGVFALTYAGHIKAARAIIGLPQAQSLLDVMKAQAAGSLATRFLGPTSYLLYPYGQFALPGFLLIVAGSASYLIWGVFKRDWAVVACGAYVVVWLVYLLLVGTFSQYWGQLFSGLGLAGLGYWVVFADPKAAWRDG